MNAISIITALWCWTVTNAEFQVAGGIADMCVLHQHSVKCWGENKWGQSGGNVDSDGNLLSSDSPPDDVIDFGDNGFVPESIDCGASHCCAMSTGGASRCWGYRHSWGAPNCGWKDEADLRTVIDEDMNWGDDDFLVAQISTGYGFTCALSTGGEVRCVGPSWNAQLGRDEPDTSYTSCDDIIGSDTVGDKAIKAIDFGLDGDGVSVFVPKKISAGSSHSCAVSVNGYLKCWGLSGARLVQGHNDGRIGNDERPVGDQPVSPLGDFMVEDVMCLSGTTCIISTTGELACFGSNYGSHILGISTLDDTTWGSNYGDHEEQELGDNLVTIDLGAGFKVKSVYGQTNQGFCAVSTDGDIKCWGRNFDGQLGYGNTDDILYTAMGEQLPAVQIGSEFTSNVEIAKRWGTFFCAYEEQQDDSLLKCWGKLQKLHPGGLFLDFGASPEAVAIGTFPPPPPPVCDPADVVNF